MPITVFELFFLLFHLNLHSTQKTSSKKIVRFEQNVILKIIFDNFQICRHFGSPFAVVFSQFLQQRTCDVDKGTRHLSPSAISINGIVLVLFSDFSLV